MDAQHYYFVNQSTGQLFVDIVNSFSPRRCVLISGMIKSPSRKINDKIKIVKLNKYNRKDIFSRVFSWILFSFRLLFVVLFTHKNSVWLISTNPPFAPWLTWLLRKKRCKVVLLVYDIYPEVLAANSIVSKSHAIYRAWYKITQRTYKNANRIICIGGAMTEYLVSQNIHLKQKISTIPNWNNINFKRSIKTDNPYRLKRDALGKIHLVYSGNLGATHDFDTILETAKKLRKNKRIIFSIIGDGLHAKRIKDYIHKNQLENILLEPFKPAEEARDVFLSADIFLVTLGTGVEKSSIPSKTYDALAAGAAILVIAPNGSELERLVNSDGVGACFKPGEVDKVADWLRDLTENSEKLSQYKKASKLLSKRYSPANACQYVQIMTTI